MTRVRLRVRAFWAALTALLVVLSGMTLLPAEPAQAAPVSITCTPGVVYSVSAAGALREIKDGGESSTLVQGNSFDSFNGLGIGQDGTSIYGYERTDNAQTAAIYTLNKSSGKWISTGANTGGRATGYQFVGGAVDISTGIYYFGGFTANGQSFGIYAYNPSTKSVSRKGVIDTNRNLVSGKLANGDMAFDGNGTLFVVRGMGDQTSIFSVTKANLQGASGTQTVAASYSGPFTTADDVNGVAFDGYGYGYLGAGSKISRWNTPEWTRANFNWFSGPSNFGSTDLATCSVPASVTLQKDIVDGRAKPGDQFKLSLKRRGTELGPATTVGSSIGPQDQKIGPVPTMRGIELTFSEAPGNADTNLDDYYSTYSCKVENTSTVLVEGEGNSGTVTIPDAGDSILCTITNSPLTANVSIHKDVVDENGENKKPGKDWTVGAKATATTDSVSSAPEPTTQKTDSNGNAKWGLKFSKDTGRATVAISETQQDGYEFKSGSCDITRLDGSKDTTKLTSDKSTDLTGIRPGDNVDCTYVNKVSDTALTLVKKVDNKDAAGTAKDTDWTLTAVGDKTSGHETIEGKTGSEAVTQAKVKAGKYSLSESDGPKGYEASDWVCKPSTGSGTVTSDKSSVTLESGDDVTCTITNTAKTGALTWGKTDESGNALEGSVWTLTDPDGQATEIEDCVAASADKCAGPDKDPAAGRLSVDKLKWGKYKLVEKKAPAGYILDDSEHTFTISGDKLTKEFTKPFENEQKPPMALPLTGGTGSQIYLIGGAALLTAAGAIALLKGLRRRNRKH